jgi:hypothetical protein
MACWHRASVCGCVFTECGLGHELGLAKRNLTQKQQTEGDDDPKKVEFLQVERGERARLARRILFCPYNVRFVEALPVRDVSNNLSIGLRVNAAFIRPPQKFRRINFVRTNRSSG